MIETIQPCRVLLADDSEVLRGLTAGMLRSIGFEVEMASDGEEALARQRANPFPVLITDVVMPNRDGLELIREISTAYPDTKIIAMSGGGPMDVALCLKVASRFGADAVLMKPFNREELFLALSRAFSEKSSHV